MNYRKILQHAQLQKNHSVNALEVKLYAQWKGMTMMIPFRGVLYLVQLVLRLLDVFFCVVIVLVIGFYIRRRRVFEHIEQEETAEKEEDIFA